MPGMMYVDPRRQRQNSWETMIPQILGNLFMAKVGQNMEIAESKRQADIATHNEAIRKETKPEAPEGYTAAWEQEEGGKGAWKFFKKATPKEKYSSTLTKQGLVIFDKTTSKVTVDPSITKDTRTADIKNYMKAKEEGNERNFAGWMKDFGKKGTTINLGNIVQQQKAKDLAKIQASINSPKFQGEVVKRIQAKIGLDWDMLDKNDRAQAIKEETDRSIKGAYPGQEVVFGIKDGKVGWYLNDKLIKLWIE